MPTAVCLTGALSVDRPVSRSCCFHWLCVCWHNRWQFIRCWQERSSSWRWHHQWRSSSWSLSYCWLDSVTSSTTSVHDDRTSS